MKIVKTDQNLTDKENLLKIIDEMDQEKLNIFGSCLLKYLHNAYDDLSSWRTTDEELKNKIKNNIPQVANRNSNFKKINKKELNEILQELAADTFYVGSAYWSNLFFPNTKNNDSEKKTHIVISTNFLKDNIYDIINDYIYDRIHPLNYNIKYESEEAKTKIFDIIDKFKNEEFLNLLNEIKEAYFIEENNDFMFINEIPWNIITRWYAVVMQNGLLSPSALIPENDSKIILEHLYEDDDDYEFKSGGDLNYMRKVDRISLLKHLTVSKEYYVENNETYSFIYKFLSIHNKELKDEEIKLLEAVFHEEIGLVDFIQKHYNISAREKIKDILTLEGLRALQEKSLWSHITWSKVCVTCKEEVKALLEKIYLLDMNDTTYDEYAEAFDSFIRNTRDISYENYDKIRDNCNIRTARVNLKESYNFNKQIFKNNPYLSNSVYASLFPHNSKIEIYFLQYLLNNSMDILVDHKVIVIKNNGSDFTIEFKWEDKNDNKKNSFNFIYFIQRLNNYEITIEDILNHKEIVKSLQNIFKIAESDFITAFNFINKVNAIKEGNE